MAASLVPNFRASESITTNMASLPSGVWIGFWEGVARKIGRDPVTQANFLKIRHFALKVFETISKTRNVLPS